MEDLMPIPIIALVLAIGGIFMLIKILTDKEETREDKILFTIMFIIMYSGPIYLIFKLCKDYKLYYP